MTETSYYTETYITEWNGKSIFSKDYRHALLKV